MAISLCDEHLTFRNIIKNVSQSNPLIAFRTKRLAAPSPSPEARVYTNKVSKRPTTHPN